MLTAAAMAEGARYRLHAPHLTRPFARLLPCLLLANCTATEFPDGRTRAGLISEYELVLESHDTAGDGKLSHGEVEAMVNLSLSSAQPASNGREMRDWLIKDYAAQDLDRDGHLSLAELLKEPLATFTCIDADNNESISQSEIVAGMGRCDTGRAYAAS